MTDNNEHKGVLNAAFDWIIQSVDSAESEQQDETASKQQNDKTSNSDATSFKQAILDKYEEVSGYPPIVDDYMPRIKNMLKEICNGQYKKDQIIDTNDTSISSNGHSGIVFTTEAICVKDSGNSTSKFIAKFEDIDFTYLKEERFLGVDISTLELNMKFDVTYQLSTTLSGFSLKGMQELIDYAISIYAENDKLEW